LASGKSSSTGNTTARNTQIGSSAQTQSVTPSQVEPVVQSYKVGDNGPAGGIIFYDKGNNSGGWRYLEVAPANTDREPGDGPSTARNSLSDIQDRRLGAGKENTNMIMAIYERIGGGINTAAWICSHLEVNGFNDWYLPSLDELIMLYNNTYSRDGSGSFRSLKYRSSTFASDGSVLGVDFSDNGKEGVIYGHEKDRIRAIRRF
jgi:hypothetical protein